MRNVSGSEMFCLTWFWGRRGSNQLRVILIFLIRSTCDVKELCLFFCPLSFLYFSTQKNNNIKYIHIKKSHNFNHSTLLCNRQKPDERTYQINIQNVLNIKYITEIFDIFLKVVALMRENIFITNSITKWLMTAESWQLTVAGTNFVLWRYIIYCWHVKGLE